MSRSHRRTSQQAIRMKSKPARETGRVAWLKPSTKLWVSWQLKETRNINGAQSSAQRDKRVEWPGRAAQTRPRTAKTWEMATDDNVFISFALNKDQEQEFGCLLDTSQRQRMQTPQCLFVPIFLMKINDLKSRKEEAQLMGDHCLLLCRGDSRDGRHLLCCSEEAHGQNLTVSHIKISKIKNEGKQ